MIPAHSITTSTGTQHVQIRLQGVVVADTQSPLLLDETGLPTRYYISRSDVRMDLLAVAPLHTTCPYKGDATYWSADLGNGIGPDTVDIAWSYEEPISEVAEIKSMLCFYPIAWRPSSTASHWQAIEGGHCATNPLSSRDLSRRPDKPRTSVQVLGSSSRLKRPVGPCRSSWWSH